MKVFHVMIISILLANATFSQNIFKANVTEAEKNEPLMGVNVFLIGFQLGASSDVNGYVEIKKIPNGTYEIKFSYIGYEEKILQFSFPNDFEIIEVLLHHQAEKLEEISVTSTRTSRLISDEPTRVEVIAGEEIDEKISMDPSNISMLLSESTGIQVQQTSAVSVNSSFRIQGLDGRYTQLLKDGFPLYSGFSGSLSIMQIPPLDLRQIEIIKGSSSTLYGGGAIAGLINLVTKVPWRKREISFLLNGTSAFGVDVSGYFSQKFESFGLIFLASINTQKPYDNNDDKFTDIPKIERLSIQPKLYFYFNENSELEIGLNYITENRIGGSLPYIQGTTDSVYNYFEENPSERFSSQIKYSLNFSENKSLTAKNALSFFKRTINLPDYNFRGRQISSFSEITYAVFNNNTNWIFGLNLFIDDFEDQSPVIAKRNYNDLTIGSFIQNTFDITKNFILESGFRADYNKDYGLFALPRVSLLIKWNKNISSRIGGGLGYKIPTIFNEDAEKINFRNVLPLNKGNLEAEKSYGFNFDMNYRTILFNQITFSINQLFFFTRLNNPIFLAQSEKDPAFFEFSSLSGYFNTRGLETNIKFTYHDIKFFLGYTYVDAATHQGGTVKEFVLTPKHKLGLVLLYEEHGNFRIGLEAYYTSSQILSNNEKTRDYWINGLMMEKKFGSIILFLNFENFLDTRQSRFGPMFLGSPSNPEFVEIYSPTDGRIINGGIKVNL